MFLVDALALESERAELTIGDLREYGKVVTEKIGKYDGRLVCNWDQTASEDYKQTKKKVIVAGKDGKAPGTLITRWYYHIFYILQMCFH